MSASVVSPSTPSSTDGDIGAFGGMDDDRGVISPRPMSTDSSTGDLVMRSTSLDCSPDDSEDAEEKARLTCQVLELQNTLDDLSTRVDKVKEENLKLKSENQVLGQYIENLMSASSVFQSTSPKSKKKSGGKGKKADK
ncbi:short coiled-coil protein B-like [Patiria miniata]|uniref:Short coiled-coil protein n=1 Tax=Patiria miniata TaxID=46514 RepID=A0A913ZWB4_PATMI|nr:short coiled-coil protein B-like [Patiria miniata]